MMQMLDEWCYVLGGNPVKNLDMLGADNSPLINEFPDSRRYPHFFRVRGLDLSHEISPLITYERPDMEMLGLDEFSCVEGSELCRVLDELRIGVPTSQLTYARGNIVTTEYDVRSIKKIGEYLLWSRVPFILIGVSEKENTMMYGYQPEGDIKKQIDKTFFLL